MSPNQARVLLPIDVLSPRLWALLIALLATSIGLSITLVAIIDALGGGNFVAAVDELFRGDPTPLRQITLVVFIVLALQLPPHAAWKGPPDDMARFGYTMTRLFIFAIWDIGSNVVFDLLVIQGGSRYSMNLIELARADLAWILTFLLGAAALISLSLRDARTGWWAWLSGKAAWSRQEAQADLKNH